MLYSALKVVITLIEKLKEALKDFELKTVSDVTLIQKTTERLNVVYLNKYLLQLIHHYMSKVPLEPT